MEDLKHSNDLPPFHPGDKVLCINVDFPTALRFKFTDMPISGRLYVVRRCQGSSVHLCGIIGEFNPNKNDEWAFDSSRFISLESYRQQRRKINWLAAQRQEMLEWQKEVDSLDQHGNPRPRRGRKPNPGPPNS